MKVILHFIMITLIWSIYIYISKIASTLTFRYKRIYTMLEWKYFDLGYRNIMKGFTSFINNID
jgi:hypothetical protein